MIFRASLYDPQNSDLVLHVRSSDYEMLEDIFSSFNDNLDPSLLVSADSPDKVQKLISRSSKKTLDETLIEFHTKHEHDPKYKPIWLVFEETKERKVYPLRSLSEYGTATLYKKVSALP